LAFGYCLVHLVSLSAISSWDNFLFTRFFSAQNRCLRKKIQPEEYTKLTFE
jgi:hypothetical protein